MTALLSPPKRKISKHVTMQAFDPEGPKAEAPDRLGQRRLIDRREYIRLLEQALQTLGYDAIAKQLAAASVSRLFAIYSCIGGREHHASNVDAVHVSCDLFC